MAAIAANRTELLQIADAVARDKSIDKQVVLGAMEEAMQRAAKARYGGENEIRVEIDPKTGETHVSRYLHVVELVENDKTEISLADAQARNPSAMIGEGVDIGPLAVIEAGVRIGDGARIGAHCVIERNAVVGAGTRLAPRVTLGFDCKLGERCILHSGVVIGADGFGFAPDRGTWVKIEQLGAVTIGNDVEIGANTCIDRGALEDTVIEDGVKLDNQIQIGHNVRIGAHTAMAGCSAIAGSTTIGKHCTIGGAAMIIGHLTLADNVHISMGTAITRSIAKPGQYSGVFPFDDNASWEKNAATLRQLHALRDRIRALEHKA